MTRRSLTGARALVTGASAGIGRELALELARHRCQLLIVARDAERLAELGNDLRGLGAGVLTVAGDVTSEAVRSQLVEAARTAWGCLDLLVNNAGVGAYGRFDTASPDRLRRVMELNFFAAVELTRAALPLLRLGHRPLIVNVSSVLGHRAVANKSEYCASKFALHGFSDALRAELVPDGIDVLLVSPGTTATDFPRHVLDDQGVKRPPARPISPAVVARTAVRAIQSGRHEVILPFPARMLVWLDRLCPTFADWLVAKYG